jgi:hypothetical protein
MSTNNETSDYNAGFVIFCLVLWIAYLLFLQIYRSLIGCKFSLKC